MTQNQVRFVRTLTATWKVLRDHSPITQEDLYRKVETDDSNRTGHSHGIYTGIYANCEIGR